MSVTAATDWTHVRPQPNWLMRLFDWRPFLVFMCMLPAAGLLLVFLTYPLGLGIWLAFTDTTIGRSGQWVGIENFEYLLEDPLFWSAVWDSDPKIAIYRDGMNNEFWRGYKGPITQASGTVAAEYILVQMYASVASGQATPEAAAREAERRARRYFR